MPGARRGGSVSEATAAGSRSASTYSLAAIPAMGQKSRRKVKFRVPSPSRPRRTAPRPRRVHVGGDELGPVGGEVCVLTSTQLLRLPLLSGEGAGEGLFLTL